MSPAPKALGQWILLALFGQSVATGDVRISEFSAVSSDRLLRWEDGIPRLGSGISWWETGFDDSKWPVGIAPLGANYPEVVTDLSIQMFGLTPTFYVRKKFTVSAANAASTADLLLDIDYDDGFIAYVNGKEVARANMGAPGAFAYADQPSYNGHGWTGNETFILGQVAEHLVEGDNVLTIQLHNLNAFSGGVFLDAGLRKATGGTVDFVTKGSEWRYFVGRVEPSGGVYDPAFLPDTEAFEPDWARLSFDDSLWSEGPGPLGYDASAHYPLGVNLISMRNNQSTLYTRREFSLSGAQLDSITSLLLTIDYDDGYVAFLNGTEIARANLGSPGFFIPFDATAAGQHDASMDGGSSNPGVIEMIEVDPGLLLEGDNVLSIQIANQSLGSSDLIAIADLTTNGGTGPVLVTSSDQWKYFIGTEEPSTVDDNSDGAVEPQFVDWIELHNDGNSAVNLTGWSLSDDDDEPRKWIFPSGTLIPARGYLLVLADGITPDAGVTELLHADFKLSADGEFLGLYDSAGAPRTEFESEYPRQYEYHSYGIDPGGGGTYGYLAEPTPGRANSGPFLSGRTKSPDFSTEGGFHGGTVTLTLSSETPGATIRYTLDGSEPTSTNGADYTSPLALTPIDNKTGRVVRARAFAAGLIPSKIKTHTYLINQHPNLLAAPALIFTGDEDRALYKKHGIMAIEGGTYVNGRWEADGIDSYNIPNNRGRSFERPFHFEMHYSDGRKGVSEDAGIRLSSSNFSRPRLRLTQTASSPWPSNATEKPSFNIFFRNDYGEEFMNHQWLDDDYSVDRYQQLRIRAGKNDIVNPFIVDEVMRRLYTDMGHHSSNGISVSVYINGSFKGFFNMTERLREPFFQEHHDSGEDWDVRQVSEFASGDNAKWNEMVTLSEQDMTVLANYQAVEQILDVDNFIDYLLLNIYGATWDWPQNNWVAARERSDEGLWRFYVWDAEGAIGRNRNPDYDAIQADLINKNTDIPRLFKELRDSPEFRLRWADRVQKHFFNGGALDDTDAPNSNVRTHWYEQAAAFEPLLQFVHGQNVNHTRIEAWTNSVSGKRSYLFGPNETQFADHGLWPTLRPPEFNQHGGPVGSGFMVRMTHNGPGTAIVYTTTDGTDPRLPGGAVSPGATNSNNGVPLWNSETLVRARVYVPSTREWSALNEAEFQVDVPPVLINEVLSHTDLPELDSIELFNPNPVSVNLRGWYLSDDPDVPKKFQIPAGVVIPAGGYVVFDETDFTVGPNAFRLSEYGETVLLSSGNFLGDLTGYSHEVDFRAAPNGVTTGRHVDREGKVHFVLLSSNTLGAANSLPKTGPIVISEIHYHPPDLPGDVDNDEDEFIELTNISTATVPLYGTDTSVPGYGDAALEDTWQLRNAVDYDFPPGTEIGPTERILVVGFDPVNDPARLAEFRSEFNVAPSVRVFGPWVGKLDNSDEEIELKYPGSADSDQGFFVPYYMMEEIDYRDSPPWPVEADGLGSSLQRVRRSDFGNDPQNWRAVTPFDPVGRDTDDDGMDDLWELLHGLAVGTNDSSLDADRDGISNGDEYRSRTHPRDPNSFLSLSMEPTTGGLRVRFFAMADVAYRIDCADSLTHPVTWTPWQTVAAEDSGREITFDVDPTAPHRFYQLVVPSTD